MVTLANLDGRSLALDLDAAFSPVIKQKYAERKIDEREQQDIELLQTAQGLAPAVSAPDKKSEGFLRRIAPGLADQLDKLNKDRNPDAVDELRKEAAMNVETAARIRKAKSPAEKQRIILERAGEFQKQGRDNRQLLKMSGMTPAEIDLQAQKAEMMGKATLKSLPPPTDGERMAARAQLAVRNPQAYAALMQEEAVQRQIEAQKAAQARAGAAQARKDANERARMEALQGYLSPQTEQVSPMGPTLEAANAGATSGQDLAALQTRQVGPQVTQDTLMQAIMDPRLSNDDRSRLEKIYEMQNPDPVERDMYKGADGYQYWTDSPTERVNPNIVQNPELPEPMSPDGKLRADYDAGLISEQTFNAAVARPKPTSSQERIAMLIDGGLSENIAKGIVAGRYVPSALGEILDVGTGLPINGGPTYNPDEYETTVPKEDVDYTGALGVGGLLSAALNKAADIGNIDQPFPEKQRASTALTNTALRTVTTLQESFPGRASVQLMNRLEEVAARPEQIFKGPQASLDLMSQTADMIEGLIKQENRKLINPRGYTTGQRALSRERIDSLAPLLKDYQAIVKSLEGRLQPKVEIAPEVLGIMDKYQ